MHSLSLKIVALFLLVAQSWLGLARGQSVCIRLDPCAQHAAASAHSECEHHSAAHDHTDAAHTHGLVDPTKHHHDDCACHLHVSMPSIDLAHGGRSLDLDAGMTLAACVVTLEDLASLCINAASEPASGVPRPPRAPPRELRAEQLALEATELLL